MALLKFGTIVVGARGTIGGATLSANKSGPYAKQWAKGANPRSNRQTTDRNRVARWSQVWQTLTGAQRTAWDAFAAAAPQQKTNSLGEVYYASGFNWFVALNTNIQAAGGAAITNAPVLAIPAAPTFVNFFFRATSSVNDTRWRVTPGASLYVSKAMVYSSAGRGTTVSKRMRVSKIGLNNADGTFPEQTQLEAIFGTIQAGQRGFFSIQAQNAEGRRGPALTMTAIATDP